MLLYLVFYSKVDIAEGKGQRLREQVKEGQVIVITNALGIGIDIVDVRIVVYVGALRQLQDYMQESRQARQDSKASKAVMVQRKGSSRAIDKVGHRVRRGRAKKGEAENKGQVEEAIEAFVEGLQYQQVVIDQAIDRYKGRVGYKEGEAQCNIYKRSKAVDTEAVEGEAADREIQEGFLQV